MNVRLCIVLLNPHAQEACAQKRMQSHGALLAYRGILLTGSCRVKAICFLLLSHLYSGSILAMHKQKRIRPRLIWHESMLKKPKTRRLLWQETALPQPVDELYVAMQQKDVGHVKVLVSSCQKNNFEWNGVRLLTLAIRKDLISVIKLLVGCGAKIHDDDIGLLLACSLKFKDSFLLDVLAKKGVRLYQCKGVLPDVMTRQQNILRLFAEGEECPICSHDMDTMENLQAAPCGHICCQECFDRWIAAQLSEGREARCAVCRTPIKIDL